MANNKHNENDNDGDIFSLGVLLGALLVIAAFGIVVMGDNYDMVNVRGMGQLICKEHGLSYSHRDFSIADHSYVPKIYCKNETSIEDGVIVGI